MAFRHLYDHCGIHKRNLFRGVVVLEGLVKPRGRKLLILECSSILELSVPALRATYYEPNLTVRSAPAPLSRLLYSLYSADPCYEDSGNAPILRLY